MDLSFDLFQTKLVYTYFLSTKRKEIEKYVMFESLLEGHKIDVFATKKNHNIERPFF